MSKYFLTFYKIAFTSAVLSLLVFGGITTHAQTTAVTPVMTIENLLQQIEQIKLMISQLQSLQTPTGSTTSTLPKNGDTVSTITDVNVRTTFGLTGTLLGEQALGSTGVVISTSTESSSGYSWVKVNFASGVDGWVVTHRLKITGTSIVPIIDVDRDGVADARDNCVNVSNATQLDTDNDGVGNACDTTPNGTPVPVPTTDSDGDGVINSIDNCPTVRNAGQWDGDRDGIGNACDAAPRDPNNGVSTTTSPVITVPKDTDGDGVADTVDNCVSVSNATQTDSDNDKVGNACDTTPNGVPTPGGSGGGTIGTGGIVGIKAAPKILFIGNSYTTAAVSRERTDSASGLFMRMLQLKSTGATYAYSVIGGSVMSELWNWTGKPAAMDPKNLLRTGSYDLVVLQSGDGLLTSGSQADYEKYTDLFAKLAKENGTDVMLYGIWAPDNMISISKGETVASNAHTFYTATAKRNTAGYAASGKAYTEAYKKFTELYGKGDDGQTAENMLTSDFVHPNPPAAYLAANMMYLAAFGVNPPTPSEFLPAGVSLSEAKVLQEIAIASTRVHSIVVPNGWYR